MDQDIRTGIAMSSNSKMKESSQPNMRAVAKRAGVSLSAVSLVVNGKPGVAPEKRARVLEAMNMLGYVHNGRRQTGAETKVVGLLIESQSLQSSNDGFYTRIIAGIEETAYRLGYRVLLHLYRRGVDPINDIRELMGRDVDGMIIANDGDITPDLIRQIAAHGNRVVLVENHLPEPIHAVTADNFTAGLIMTKYLIELGHRRIAALPGPSKYSSLRDRLRGHLVALMEHGIPIDPALQPAPISGEPRKGYRQMRQLLELSQPPTAVFAVSDKSAFGAMEAIKEAGLRIPDDISITGIDDVHESANASPPLTTYHVPKHKLGEIAVGLMHNLLTSDMPPVKTSLIGHLVERASAAPLPGLEVNRGGDRR